MIIIIVVGIVIVIVIVNRYIMNFKMYNKLNPKMRINNNNSRIEKIQIYY